MFKKIILILIFSLVPSNASASVNYDNIDWINFDWASVVPDKNTIDLSKMYLDFYYTFKKETSTVNVIHSPGFNKNIENILYKAYLDASFNFGFNDINLYLIDENGVAWFNNLFNSSPNINVKNYFLNCNVKIQKVCAMADFINRNNFYFYINSKHNETKEDLNHIAHHEVAHSYAWNLRNNGYEDLNNCWIDEGLANAVGFSSSSIFYETQNKRNKFILTIKNIFTDLNNKEEMINLFKKQQNENKFCYQDLGGYSVGMLIVESLYINYGIKNVNNFIKDWGIEKNLSKSLDKHLKISEKQFYNISFDYVISSYKKALTSNL
jgi:hypothetical protein